MIARVQGTLEAVVGDRALVRLEGGITLEILLPAFAAMRLAPLIEQTLTLHTHTFLEGQAQGATMLPRLAGFTDTADRRFYALFVTCKGIGYRRALRAMTLSSAQIAAAIENRDLALLQSLPEIGKRTAETIVATLRGRVEEFVAPGVTPAAGTASAGRGAAGEAAPGSLAQEALALLTQLGERRSDAAAWIDQVLTRDAPPPPTDVEGLINEVYRVKAGS